MNDHYSIHGQDESGEVLWEARILGDRWWGTGRSYLLVCHYSLKDVLEFWMNEVPVTYRITTSWNALCYPARVIPNTVAELAHKELSATFPLGPNA